MLPKFVQHIIDDTSVHKVSPVHFREKIYKHLIRLSPSDRYLRFGHSVKDEGIRKYVDKMTNKDYIFVIFNDRLQIIAMAHLANYPNDVAEIGFSVNAEDRKKDFATKLFNRAMLTAKVLEIKELIVYFLPENKAMYKTAQKFGMSIVSEDGDMKGKYKVENVTNCDMIEYAISQQMNIFDFLMKTSTSQFKLLKKLFINVPPKEIKKDD